MSAQGGMHPYIERLYVQADRRELGSGITQDEGAFIQGLIASNKCKNTLEIGCAFGYSSLFITNALGKGEGRSHTIIDPGQSKHFNGVGAKRLAEADFSDWTLIERPSELALPALLDAGRRFDLALIDGYHTFDHTLLDFFYVSRLLNEGGVVVFDDVSMRSVHHVVRYVNSYACYQLIGGAGDRGWQRASLNRFKLALGWLLRPLTLLAGDALSNEFLDNTVVHPETIKPMSSHTMLAFRKTAADRRDPEWFQEI